MTVPLTEIAIKNAKPKEKPYKLADSEGLHLYVKPDGGRFWRFKYRYHNKEKLLSFGKYPLTTLADARRRKETAKKQLLEGIDPSAQAKQIVQQATQAHQTTFSYIANEFINKLEKEGWAV